MIGLMPSGRALTTIVDAMSVQRDYGDMLSLASPTSPSPFDSWACGINIFALQALEHFIVSAKGLSTRGCRRVLHGQFRFGEILDLARALLRESLGVLLQQEGVDLSFRGDDEPSFVRQ